MPPFLSAGTFSASSPRSGGLEYELQIKHYTDLDKKIITNNNKKTTIVCSVQVYPRIQGAFGKSCSTCCAPPFRRFEYELGIKPYENQTIWQFALVLSQERVLFLTAHEEMQGVTFCDKCLSKARELDLKTRTDQPITQRIQLVLKSIRSLICIIRTFAHAS